MSYIVTIAGKTQPYSSFDRVVTIRRNLALVCWECNTAGHSAAIGSWQQRFGQHHLGGSIWLYCGHPCICPIIRCGPLLSLQSIFCFVTHCCHRKSLYCLAGKGSMEPHVVSVHHRFLSCRHLPGRYEDRFGLVRKGFGQSIGLAGRGPGIGNSLSTFIKRIFLAVLLAKNYIIHFLVCFTGRIADTPVCKGRPLPATGSAISSQNDPSYFPIKRFSCSSLWVFRAHVGALYILGFCSGHASDQFKQYSCRCQCPTMVLPDHRCRQSQLHWRRIFITKIWQRKCCFLLITHFWPVLLTFISAAGNDGTGVPFLHAYLGYSRDS